MVIGAAAALISQTRWLPRPHMAEKVREKNLLITSAPEPKTLIPQGDVDVTCHADYNRRGPLCLSLCLTHKQTYIFFVVVCLLESSLGFLHEDVMNKTPIFTSRRGVPAIRALQQ